MPYGIPDSSWRRLPAEDQQQIIKEYFAAGGQTPASGPGSRQGPQAPTPTPPRETQAGAAPPIVWAYVRSLNSFPGNHPYFDNDRAAGVGGYMLKASDPYLAFGAQACRDAGFRVGVWDDPQGETAEAYAVRLGNAANAVNADVVAPDMEAVAKGYAGSPGWQYNIDAANALRSVVGSMPIAVTPLPLQDDFNYAAWINVGSDVWVQSYGSELSTVFDPIEVRNRAIANGVPPGRVTVILPAGSLSTTIPRVQNAGLGYWIIYTIDDVGSADRSVPFGDNSGDDGSQPFVDVSSDYGVIGIDEGADVEIDAEYEDVEPDQYAWDLVTADEAGTLDDFLGIGGDRSLQAVRGTPGGGIHPTLGLPNFPAIDFWGKPGTIVLAPFYGIIRRFSGYNPAIGWADKPGGPFGWTIYFRAGAGYDFFITHLGTRIVNLGAAVAEGQPIATVGNMPGDRPSHTHVGAWDGGGRRPPDVRTAAGNVIRARAFDAEDMRQLVWLSRAGGGGPPGPKQPTAKPIDLDTVNGAWLNLMQASDSKRQENAKSLRSSADRLMGIIK